MMNKRDYVRYRVIEAFGGKCEIGGEDLIAPEDRGFATLDHRLGGGNRHRKQIGGDNWKWAYRILRQGRLAEVVAILRLICSNCHSKHGAKGPQTGPETLAARIFALAREPQLTFAVHVSMQKKRQEREKKRQELARAEEATVEFYQRIVAEKQVLREWVEEYVPRMPSWWGRACSVDFLLDQAGRALIGSGASPCACPTCRDRMEKPGPLLSVPRSICRACCAEVKVVRSPTRGVVNWA